MVVSIEINGLDFTIRLWAMSNTATKQCPRCNTELTQLNTALSRKDNSTEICSSCATKEALEDVIKSLVADKVEYARKKVQDVEIGDKLCPSYFGLKTSVCSPVEITSISPYGTSNHSINLSGKYKFYFQPANWEKESDFPTWDWSIEDSLITIFDKMIEVKVVKK